jgi:hypothetical protein
MITSEVRKLLNPYLIWESRVNLNAALPEKDRFYTRFSKDQCDMHEIRYWVLIQSSMIVRATNTDCITKRTEIAYDLFSRYLTNRPYILILNNLNLKKVIIERLLYFTDMYTFNTYGINKKLSKKFKNLANNIIAKILTLQHNGKCIDSKRITID